MPIYEYRCLDCGHQFELMQKFSDPPAETCPSCAGIVQKLISRSAFHLKGSGWYVTDYGRNGKANDKATGKSDSESSTESSDTKGSDTKGNDTKSTSESSGSASPASTSTESTKSATAS
jgi:putative FmdB family regulatory protein